MSRPDLHTLYHDNWDAGGYCNELVLDADGSGEVCGYRQTDDDLHERRACPGWEYATTETGRKSGVSVRPEGEGWIPNPRGSVTRAMIYADEHDEVGQPASHAQPWARFDWHEEEYWMRRKPESPTSNGHRWPCTRFYTSSSERDRCSCKPEAAADPKPARVTRERIEGHWLVEDVNEHTCGTGPGGHGGVHEPGCGSVPIVDLRGLDGWASLVADVKAEQYEIDRRALAVHTRRANLAGQIQALREFTARLRSELAAADALTRDWASEEYRHGFRSVLMQADDQADRLEAGPDPEPEPEEPPRAGTCPRCAARIDETDLS